ncbi:hypothetical protein MMPV_003638 [Pyropia vietnamensis]
MAPPEAPPATTDLPVAVVTASTAGIGLATAARLAAAGYHVVISSRSAAHVDAALARLRSPPLPSPSHLSLGSAGTPVGQALPSPPSLPSVSGLVCNVADAAHRSALVAHATALRSDGAVAAVVLNAAASPSYGPLVATPAAAWDTLWAVNVRAAALLAAAFVPALAVTAAAAAAAAAASTEAAAEATAETGSMGGGRIGVGGCSPSLLFVSSIGAYMPLPSLGGYSVTKTALAGLVSVLATELAPRGIRVNGVAPGLVRTRFSERIWRTRPPGAGGGGQGGGGGRGRSPPDEDARRGGFDGKATTTPVVGRGDGGGRRRDVRPAAVNWIPMRRLGEADEIAAVIAFLVGPGASYMTGETVAVAGGVRSRL